jgi:hypothetical protein
MDIRRETQTDRSSTMASAAARLPLLLRASRSYDLTCTCKCPSSCVYVLLTLAVKGEIFGAAIWTEVEILVGLFCSSAPALKPLVQRYVPRLLGGLNSSLNRGRSDILTPLETFGSAGMRNSRFLGNVKILDSMGSPGLDPEAMSANMEKRVVTEFQEFDFDFDEESQNRDLISHHPASRMISPSFGPNNMQPHNSDPKYEPWNNVYSRY